MFLNSKKGFFLTVSMMVTALTVCAQSSADVVAEHKSEHGAVKQGSVKTFEAIDPSSLDIEKDLTHPKRTLTQHLETIAEAKKGNLSCVNCVASYYLNGGVLKKDLETGIGLYLWSAEHKNSNAMYELGKFYEKKDASQSIEWKKLAAHHGHFGAAEELYGSDEDGIY